MDHQRAQGSERVRREGPGGAANEEARLGGFCEGGVCAKSEDAGYAACGVVIATGRVGRCPPNQTLAWLEGWGLSDIALASRSDMRRFER